MGEIILWENLLPKQHENKKSLYDWTFGIFKNSKISQNKQENHDTEMVSPSSDSAVGAEPQLGETVEPENDLVAADHRSIRSTGSAFAAIKKRFSKFFVKGNSEVFTDPDFPPTNDSLFKIDPMAAVKGEPTSATDSGTLPDVQWRRPEEFIEGESRIFDDRIKYDDIQQGQLGDCWLMCSLAAIAENEVLVRDLFDLEESRPEVGTYVVRLCKDGSWKRMMLDSFIPCTPGEGPLYSQCAGDELWCMLLEKAFAKCNGSYAAIRSGFPYEAMIDLTGAPYKDFNLADPLVTKSISDGSLWTKLRKYDSLNYVMTLSTPGVDHTTEGGDRTGGGLVPGHAYSLLGVHEADSLRLCKIRNPWVRPLAVWSSCIVHRASCIVHLYCLCIISCNSICLLICSLRLC